MQTPSENAVSKSKTSPSEMPTKPWWMHRNEHLVGDLWYRKDRSLITFKLPLTIPDEKTDITEYIKRRLIIIRLYDFLDVKTLIHLISEKKNAKDCSSQIAKLKQSFPIQINDFDKTELIVSALKDKKLPDEIRAQIIPRVNHAEMFKDEPGFLEHESKYVMEKVAEYALPRLRAKMAVRELLFVLDPTWDSFCELVKICPIYLNSPWAAKKLHALRETVAYGKNTESNNAKKAIAKLQKALIGQTKRQERQIPYFQVHQEFKDMVESFKRYAEDSKIENKKKQAKENLRIFAEVFQISENIINLVKTGKSKPSFYAIEALIEKKLIQSEASYRNNVQPYMKQLFALYPDLEFDWSHVRRFIDITARHPGAFANLDIWGQLEEFKMVDPKEFKDAYPILANWV